MAPPLKMPVPSKPLQVIEQLLKNNDPASALEFIKMWDLKVRIEHGRIIDMSNGIDAWLRRFITADTLMLELKDETRKLATEDDEVLITGETGTGKELLARALHGERTGKFVAINCAGLPKELIESELFGHEKGAFTGAINSKTGLMSVAKDGTLFLDEIGEMPVDVQGKLLRALQEKIIRKVGSNTSETINCRVVSATNRNLSEMCDTKHFRVDLYARLGVFELHTTPLRNRLCDVLPILQSLDGGKELSEKFNGWNTLTYPFNIRSLQAMCRRYKVLGKLPI